MPNNFKPDKVVLDTFTGAIDVRAALGTDARIDYRLNSIEWQKPTTAAHTATITEEDGTPIFEEECVTAKQSIIKYYHGHKITNLKIGVGGVQSGKIIILFDK